MIIKHSTSFRFSIWIFENYHFVSPFTVIIIFFLFYKKSLRCDIPWNMKMQYVVLKRFLNGFLYAMDFYCSCIDKSYCCYQNREIHFMRKYFTNDNKYLLFQMVTLRFRTCLEARTKLCMMKILNNCKNLKIRFHRQWSNISVSLQYSVEAEVL